MFDVLKFEVVAIVFLGVLKEYICIWKQGLHLRFEIVVNGYNRNVRPIFRKGEFLFLKNFGSW